MVPVGDVDGIHAGKSLLNSGDFVRIRDQPDAVAHVSRGNKIADGRLLHVSGLDLADPVIVSVGQEDRPGVGAAGVHVADAVLLLVGSRVLVLADDAALVVVRGRQRRDAGLRAAVHRLRVDVEGGRVVLHQQFLADPVVQQIGRGCVYLVAVEIRPLGELRLRAVHREEGQRVLAHDLPRLGGAHDVIGKRRDPVLIASGRAIRPKRSDVCHMCI